MFKTKSKIAMLLGTLSLVSASAYAGSVDGTQADYELEIQPASVTCKKELVNTGYTDQERDVLRLKATPESAPGLLEHTDFLSWRFGGDANICKLLGELKSALYANQNKLKVTVTFSTALYADGAGGPTSALYENVIVKFPLGTKTVSLSSQKTVQVTK